MIGYSTRNNAFTKPQTFYLAGDRLLIESAGFATAVVPLREIAEVALAFAPTRPEPNRFRCTLRTAKSGSFVFFNRAYRGVLDFADASAEYVAFVRAVHGALAQVHPACRFTAGASGAAYAASVASLVFALLVLIAVAVLLFSVGLAWLVAFKALLIAIYTPVAIRWLKSNRPRTYAPTDIPPDVFPAAVTSAAAAAGV